MRYLLLLCLLTACANNGSTVVIGTGGTAADIIKEAVKVYPEPIKVYPSLPASAPSK